MSFVYNRALKLTVFGGSHKALMGITIDGLKAGLKIDTDYIDSELARRRSILSISTSRLEKDKYDIISGLFNGYTDGTPLTFLVHNECFESKAYNKDIIRPSHADYTAWLKYQGYQDYRGGGAFSGRMTTLITIAGAISKQLLKSKGINIYSHIKSIGTICDDALSDVNSDKALLMEKDFPCISEEKRVEMMKEIMKIKEEGDSIGGTIETVISGVDGGIGEPYFNSMESDIASLVFSIPACKGIEFGKGFAITRLKGSEANDEFVSVNKKIITSTNNNGGINGGITNGMPIIFTTAFKPTPSISKSQNLFNIKTKKNINTKLEGSHDPSITHRALVVVESVGAIAVLNAYLERYGYMWL